MADKRNQVYYAQCGFSLSLYGREEQATIRWPRTEQQHTRDTAVSLLYPSTLKDNKKERRLKDAEFTG
jgi:hypothetical protein